MMNSIRWQIMIIYQGSSKLTGAPYMSWQDVDTTYLYKNTLEVKLAANLEDLDFFKSFHEQVKQTQTHEWNSWTPWDWSEDMTSPLFLCRSCVSCRLTWRTCPLWWRWTTAGSWTWRRSSLMWRDSIRRFQHAAERKLRPGIRTRWRSHLADNLFWNTRRETWDYWGFFSRENLSSCWSLKQPS